MLVTDKNDYVQSYALTIKNVKLIANNVSTKSYENGAWELGLYSLELPWQTDIDIFIYTYLYSPSFNTFNVITFSSSA